MYILQYLFLLVLWFIPCRGEPAFYNFLVEKTGHGYSLVINDPEIPTPVCEAAVSVWLILTPLGEVREILYPFPQPIRANT